MNVKDACQGMLKAEDKKQFMKNNFKELMPLLKNREVNNYYYWKLSHEIYHSTKACLVNIKRICSEPELGKLHDIAKYDKDLYHMGAFVYDDDRYYYYTGSHTDIQNIVSQYSKRKGYKLYQLFCEKILKFISNEKLLNYIPRKEVELLDETFQTISFYNKVETEIKQTKEDLKNLYQNGSQTAQKPQLQSRRLKF